MFIRLLCFMFLYLFFSEYAIIQPNENVFIESEISRPKRTGGLSLFCRKVYNLVRNHFLQLFFKELTDEYILRRP